MFMIFEEWFTYVCPFHLNTNKTTEENADKNKLTGTEEIKQPSVTFTQLALETTWKKYAADLKTKGKAMVYLNKNKELSSQNFENNYIYNRIIIFTQYRIPIHPDILISYIFL